ncbi:MAG TPA: PD-(D/E)XK nuclease family protein, partial [Candidatus Paceibacterota bacterium]|nr:PD-(D/E)XK nuclease family protein [Candidatus Paceibacterota bacterium]
ILELEKHFVLDFDIGKEKHHLSGIMDRVDTFNDGRYEIIDYKTGKRVPSQKDTDKDLQLSIYALGLLSFWPKLNTKDISLSLYFLKPDIKVTSSRTAEQLDGTKQEIKESILAITKSDFSPTPSRLCDWCGYRRRCPVWHDYYVQSNLSGKKVAQLVDEYFTLQKKDYQLNQRLKEIKEQINSYCVKHNISQISGKTGVLKRVTGKKITYNINEMINILSPINQVEKVLMVNQKMLGEVLQELPDSLKKTILAARKEEDLETLA